MVVVGDNSDWYIANFEEKGYYRVNYDEANWGALSNQLMSDHTVRTPTIEMEVQCT